MKLIPVLLFSCFTFISQAQVFVQLELFNDPKAKKYGVGDKIVYKVDYLSDVWRKGIIEQILPEENTLVLNNDLVSIDQVTHFMLYRNSVNYIGGMLQTFGTVYSVFGIVAIIRDDIPISQVLSIGGGSFIVGWLLRRLFYKIPITLGENNRLRIVDLRFFVPEDNSSGN